jgi:hypothetical protein
MVINPNHIEAALTLIRPDSGASDILPRKEEDVYAAAGRVSFVFICPS